MVDLSEAVNGIIHKKLQDSNGVTQELYLNLREPGSSYLKIWLPNGEPLEGDYQLNERYRYIVLPTDADKPTPGNNAALYTMQYVRWVESSVYVNCQVLAKAAGLTAEGDEWVSATYDREYKGFKVVCCHH